MLTDWRAAGISRVYHRHRGHGPAKSGLPLFFTAQRTPPYTPTCTPRNGVAGVPRSHLSLVQEVIFYDLPDSAGFYGYRWK
jgi:hypothetical protein